MTWLPICAIVAVWFAQSCFAQAPTPTPTQPPLGSDQRFLAERQAASATSSVSINIPQNAQAGSMSVLNPAITATPTLIKILSGNPVTFSWTLTNVLVTPKSLTLQAFCSENQFTYPIGPATGIPGTSTTFVWDPAAYQATAGAEPLPQASYTFRAFDERGWSQGPTGGYMSPQNGPVFALYNPQVYTPLASWTCVQCSGATIWRVPSPLSLAIVGTIVALFAGGWKIFRQR